MKRRGKIFSRKSFYVKRGNILSKIVLREKIKFSLQQKKDKAKDRFSPQNPGFFGDRQIWITNRSKFEKKQSRQHDQ